MHKRAIEPGTELVELGDAVIQALLALSAGAANPFGELRQRLHTYGLVAAVSFDHEAACFQAADTPADGPGCVEVTCAITDCRAVRTLRELCAHEEMTPGQLATAIIVDVLHKADAVPGIADWLTGGDTPAHGSWASGRPHLTPVPRVTP